MSEENATKIFEKFSRIDNPLTRKIQGSGLGLFITKTLVDKMNGQISFKNLEKEKAMEFLNKIVTSIEENKKFLNESGDNNNIFFKYDDMDVLIWTNAGTYSIRIFWQGFDSTWEKTAFERSKRRFEKKIK
jgi:signal transduction histidine kinase